MNGFSTILIIIILCSGVLGAIFYSTYDAVTHKMEENDKGFLIVYVAGPYWSDTHEGRTNNTYNAIDAGIAVYYKCQYAIIPHMGHWIDPRMTELGYPERPNSFWYVLDNMILPDADILLKIGDSRGANAEANLALSIGIPVVTSIDQIPNNCPEGGYKDFYDGSKIGT